MNLRRWQALLLVGAAAFLTYANTLSHDFVWDDEILVKANSYIRNPHTVPAIFTTSLNRGARASAAYYRPLQTVTYMVDYHFWGLRPLGYHLGNVMLHVLAAVMAAWLLEIVGARRTVALAAALLFAVHPVNANAVAYVAGRADMLAAAGLLGALVALLAYVEATGLSARRRLGCLVATVGSFGLALFSRESAMLVPALAVLCIGHRDRWRGRGLWRDLLAVVPLLLVLAAFIAWRQAVLAIGASPTLAAWSLGLGARLAVVCRSLATYVGLLCWPAHLHMDRQVFSGDSAQRWLTMAGALVAGGILGVIVTCWRRRPLISFGCLWFVITILPVSGMLGLTASVAEHWLYVPALGLYLAASEAIALVPLPRRVLTWGAAVIIVLLSGRTMVRNQDWANAVSIFAQTTANAPDSQRARSNLGLSYSLAGDLERALTELLAAERMDPHDPTVKANLAVVYRRQGDLVRATEKEAECLALDPANPGTLLRIAELYEQRGNLKRARHHYLAALALSEALPPRFVFVAYLQRHDQLREARWVAREATVIEPFNAEAWLVRGVVARASGDLAAAREAFGRAASLDRHRADAWVELGRLAETTADAAGARAAYATAARIRPDDVPLGFHYGLLLWQAGDRSAAAREFRRLERLAPESQRIADALQHLEDGDAYAAYATNAPPATGTSAGPDGSR